MPPAFNLSQDQTLQFDLDKFKVLRLSSKRTSQFASNAHAYRLYIFNVPAKTRLASLFLLTLLRSAEPRIIIGLFISRQHQGSFNPQHLFTPHQHRKQHFRSAKPCIVYRVFTPHHAKLKIFCPPLPAISVQALQPLNQISTRALPKEVLLCSEALDYIIGFCR